jgi:hypothetical protein
MRKIIVTLVFVSLISGCGDTGCGNEIASRTASANGKLDVVVYNRNCGATTGFNTQVSIVPTGQEPKGSGTVLILDGTVPLKVNWTSETSLTLFGMRSARVFHKAKQSKGVTISYEP